MKVDLVWNSGLKHFAVDVLVRTTVGGEEKQQNAAEICHGVLCVSGLAQIVNKWTAVGDVAVMIIGASNGAYL